MGAETKRERTGAIVRVFRPEDAAAAIAVLKESLEAANWSEKSYVESLGWRGAVALASEFEGRVTGFIIGRQIAGDGEILNLAVIPERRRQGEGRALLTAALDEFRARRTGRIFLEVRESNQAAIAFYAKHGFAETGRRAGYYQDPAEAAILMEKKLTG
jgi:tRNA threonylcarbamoyladenosine biosynthesis protein TsaB